MARASLSRSLVGVLIAFLLSIPILDMTSREAAGYTPHAPIVIVGDANFTSSNGVVGGSGIASDPFVLSGWEFDTNLVDAITIKNTTAHFVVRDIFAYASSTSELGASAVRLASVTNGRVENITTSVIMGIVLESCSNITIASNHINSSFGWGIVVGSSSDVAVTGNNISSSFSEGIFLAQSRNISVSGNTLSSDGIILYGYSVEHYASHRITPDNLANGKPVLYYSNCNNIVVDRAPAGQVIVANCTNARVANMTMNDSDIGIALAYVDGASVDGNSISNQSQGIVADTSTNVTLTSNTVTSCRDYCIHFEFSSLGRAAHNEVTGTGWDGFYIDQSSDVALMANNISGVSEGVRLRSSANITLIGNNISMNNQGIFADSQNSNLLISGNNISGNIVYGIDASRSENVSVVANRISGGIGGVRVSAAFTNISIVNNSISYSSSGAQISDAANVTVAGNNVSHCGNGMNIFRATVRIRNNTFHKNDGIALDIRQSNDTGITDNYFLDNGQGLRLEWSTNATVTGNSFSSNGVIITALQTRSSTFQFDTHTITPDNLVNGKPILYYKRCSNLDLDGVVAGQVIVANCRGVRIANSQIDDADAAVEIALSSDVLVTQNTLTANLYGVYQESSVNVTISNNVISSSPEGGGIFAFGSKEFHAIGNVMSDMGGGLTFYFMSNATVASNNIVSNIYSGISVLNSENITVTVNNISHNNVGISLIEFMGTTDVLIHHNNFVNNTIQASDNSGSESSWDDGYPSGGNYWSNYTGGDWCTGPNQDICPSPDGFGDTPFVIDGDSSDRYPLMWPIGVTDNVPPTVSIIQPGDGENVTTTLIVVSGNASDTGGSGLSRVEVRVDGGAWAIATGKASWNTTVELTSGLNTIEARSWDYAGNPSAIATVAVTLSPTVRIVAPANGTTIESPSLTVAGTSEHSELVQVRVDGGGWLNATGTSTWSVTVDVSAYADGQTVVEARAFNDTFESERDRIVIVLRLPPITVTILSPEENAVVSGVVEVSGTAINSSEVQVWIDGLAWTTVEVASDLSWRFNLDTTLLSKGAHVIEAKAVLGERESSVVARNVTVDSERHEEGLTFLLVLVVSALLVVIVLVLFVWRRRRKPAGVEERKEGKEQELERSPPPTE